MLKIAFKASDPVDWAPAIRTCIRDVYKMDPAEYAADIESLDALRNECMHLEVHENALQNLLKYYGQLVLLGGKLPLDMSPVCYRCFDVVLWLCL
jgi:programmed cell death 6-interacting protein